MSEAYGSGPDFTEREFLETIENTALESPIEAAFCRVLFSVRTKHGQLQIDHPTCDPDETMVDHWGDHVGVSAQVRVGRYRLDFIVSVVEDGRRRLIGVECDGRAHHSSAADVARDRFRDRTLAADGVWVIRFSGSEIMRDPGACAREIEAIVSRAMAEIRHGW